MRLEGRTTCHLSFDFMLFSFELVDKFTRLMKKWGFLFFSCLDEFFDKQKMCTIVSCHNGFSMHRLACEQIEVFDECKSVSFCCSEVPAFD